MRRAASHAGSWYSNDPKYLSAQIDGWVEDARKDLSFKSAAANSCPSRIVMGPHAGFSYSGPTCAYSYTNIAAAKIKTVWILGPSHFYHLRGCDLSGAAVFESPLGDVAVDTALVGQLEATGLFGKMDPKSDEQEHSIEMHVPFLQRALQGQEFKIVPLIVGSIGAETEEKYADMLAPYLSDPSHLFVISSDFCHWGKRFRYTPYDAKLGKVYEYIEKLDGEAIQVLCSRSEIGIGERGGEGDFAVVYAQCVKHRLPLFTA
jgi:AmmeMemoRadiSam system protein B